jgi:ATP-binding cassette subfamily C (CFTR/MRP) protein 1
MLKKDERVRLISEILNGIKLLKLYAWELSFVKRINSLREEEVGKVSMSHKFFVTDEAAK